MADAIKGIVWPNGSWRTLKKITRAWYAAEESGKEMTQKAISEIAGIQPSRLSMNKPFLQAVGIVEPEGIALTEGGKRLGLGLQNDNERVTQQALQSIVRDNSLLRQLWDVIRGRGPLNKDEFEAEVLMLTKQGKASDYFATGVGVLEDILLESGLVGMSDNGLRPTTSEQKEETRPISATDTKQNGSGVSGLRRIPIPVSAESIWYVEVSANPDPFEIEKFIDMQKLIFRSPQ